MTRPTPRQLELLSLVARLSHTLGRYPHPREVCRLFGGDLRHTIKTARRRGLLAGGGVGSCHSTLEPTSLGFRFLGAT